MKKIACLVTTAVLLAGCAGTSGGTNDSPPKGSNADKTAAAKKTSKPKDEAPKFGQAFTWKDGITVKVSKPSKFEPSDSAYVEKEQDTYLKFGIRIINKSGKTFDPNVFTASLQSGNEEMEQVFDGSSVGEDSDHQVAGWS